MNFYTVLKYILMALLAVILVVGYLATDDTPAQQTVPANAGPQTKFNF
jgi:Flp pilus assembly protein CpaB